MRVKERHAGEPMALLFADTRIEDEDLYRFLDDSAAQIGLPLVRITDGRTPFQVFRDERFLGNSLTAPCSKILKQRMLDKWDEDNLTPENAVLHFGLDWTEFHRLERLRKKKPEWQCEAYLTEAPYLTKQDMLSWMRREGLKPPRLYGFGFHHNNCGGGCVRSGKAQFALLLKTFPQRYLEWERNEEETRAFLERQDVTILKDQTLREFRESVEAKIPHDEFDWGGCGCAVD